MIFIPQSAMEIAWLHLAGMVLQVAQENRRLNPSTSTATLSTSTRGSKNSGVRLAGRRPALPVGEIRKQNGHPKFRVAVFAESAGCGDWQSPLPGHPGLAAEDGFAGVDDADAGGAAGDDVGVHFEHGEHALDVAFGEHFAGLVLERAAEEQVAAVDDRLHVA